MHLATGGTVTMAGAPNATKAELNTAGIPALFGVFPDSATMSAVINGTVVGSATYNGQRYNGDGTFTPVTP